MRARSLLVSLVTALTLVLAIFGMAAPASAMSFRAVQLGDAGAVIAATGQITEATPGEFLSFVQQNYGSRDLHAVVFLNSPGGRVLASMEFGTLLRRMGAAAVVAGVYPSESGRTVMTNGQCFSACVYALMGARKRVIPASSQVGIHRMFAYEAEYDENGGAYVRRRYDSGAMGTLLKQYTSRMGVSPALITAAEHISSDGLKILSRSEIRKYHLGVPRL